MGFVRKMGKRPPVGKIAPTLSGSLGPQPKNPTGMKMAVKRPGGMKAGGKVKGCK